MSSEIIRVMSPASESRHTSHLQTDDDDSKNSCDHVADQDGVAARKSEDKHCDVEEEPLDPRIQQKLEELNDLTERINELEKAFDEANASFRSYLSDYSDKLKAFAEKIGSKNVCRARVYYEAKERANAAQAECQQTVAGYEQACRLHVQARDEIQDTEQKFQSNGHSPEFDVAWQEQLNMSTQKLRTAEDLKFSSKERHEKSMKEFMDAEERVQRLEKQLRRPILKSQPYFQESAKFKLHLIEIKQQIEVLSEKIVAAKRCYSITLRDLERISEEIHERRNLKLMKLLDSSKHNDSGDSQPSHQSDFSYDSLVPELNVSSSRFQSEVRPKSLAYLSPDPSVSSSGSSCGQLLDEESPSADISNLNLNGFDEVLLDD